MGVGKSFFENVAIFFKYLASPIRPQGWQGHKFHNLYFSHPRDAYHQKMITTAFQEEVQKCICYRQCMLHDHGQRPTAIGQLRDSGDLKI